MKSLDLTVELSSHRHGMHASLRNIWDKRSASPHSKEQPMITYFCAYVIDQ